MTLRREDVLAYLNRDWTGLQRAGKVYRASQVRRHGYAEAVRMMDALHAAAKQLNPDWPTQEERAKDLATHSRVALALARPRKPSPR